MEQALSLQSPSKAASSTQMTSSPSPPLSKRTPSQRDRTDCWKLCVQFNSWIIHETNKYTKNEYNATGTDYSINHQFLPTLIVIILFYRESSIWIMITVTLILCSAQLSPLLLRLIHLSTFTQKILSLKKYATQNAFDIMKSELEKSPWIWY